MYCKYNEESLLKTLNTTQISPQLSVTGDLYVSCSNNISRTIARSQNFLEKGIILRLMSHEIKYSNIKSVKYFEHCLK